MSIYVNMTCRRPGPQYVRSVSKKKGAAEPRAFHLFKCRVQKLPNRLLICLTPVFLSQPGSARGRPC